MYDSELKGAIQKILPKNVPFQDFFPSTPSVVIQPCAGSYRYGGGIDAGWLCPNVIIPVPVILAEFIL